MINKLFYKSHIVKGNNSLKNQVKESSAFYKVKVWEHEKFIKLFSTSSFIQIKKNIENFFFFKTD